MERKESNNPWTLQTSLKHYSQWDIVSEPMTQLPRLNVKVILQGHGIYPSIFVCSISPKPFEQFSLNFTQMFLSVIQCAEPMTLDSTAM